MFALGDVFRLRCTLCRPPKTKFFVVAQVEPLWMFLINSELTEFATLRPKYSDACPPLLASEHPSFLTHDSVLGCADRPSFEYSRERLEVLLSADPTIKVGSLSLQACREVSARLKRNHVMPGKYLKVLVPLWQQFEPAEQADS